MKRKSSSQKTRQKPYWDGYIRLSLVTFPIQLYAAASDREKVHLHKIERKTHQRIHYRNVTEDGHEVAPEDVIKGYEVEKDSYVPIEDSELEKLKIESQHTIDLIQFTDAGDIDPLYFDNAYFVTPGEDMGEEAFAVLRDALKKSGKIALGKITISNKEKIAAIRPYDRGLVLETLRYDDEVRKTDALFRNIPASASGTKEEVALAEELIRKKTGPFRPEKFTDTYQEGLLHLIEAKLHNRKLPVMREPRKPENVVNIMDALKRSLAQSGEGGKAPATKKKRRA
jgi:DNA end-binding protein Ku